MTLVASLLLSIMFVSLAVHWHRPSAVVNAVLAPGLIGLWLASLDLAGQIIGEDRWSGRFELLVASRVPLALVVLGRVLVIVLVGGLAFAESWLVAALGFGQVVRIADPGVFVAGVVVTCFAMAGTATLLASAFVLSRLLEIFQNTLSYPFYILGGVIVPVTALPGFLYPGSRILFLSWSADLLRASARGTARGWPAELAIIAGLGALALVIGVRLTRVVVDRTRRNATVSHA
jgi:ABC-2 type transport system permease protein